MYLEMGFIKRKKLHFRLAELIEATYKNMLNEYIEILSYHYSKAQAYEKAFQYSLLAAEKALSFQSYQQGIVYLEKCLSYKEYISLDMQQASSILQQIEQARARLLSET